MAWEVLGDCETAVKAHRNSLDRLGEYADIRIKLDSYQNGHVVSAYSQTGKGREWIDNVLDLCENAPADLLDPDNWFYLINGFCANLLPQDAERRNRSCAFIDKIYESDVAGFHVYGEGVAQKVIEIGSVLFLLFYRFYSLVERDDKALNALEKAKAMAEDLFIRATKANYTDKAVNEAAFVGLMHLGMFGDPIDIEEALDFMRKADKVANSPCGPHAFWLSAMILESGGDRQEALHYLRRVAEDKKWAYGGMCVRPQEEFYKHRAFASVREDPEFITIIESLRQQASE